MDENAWTMVALPIFSLLSMFKLSLVPDARRKKPCCQSPLQVLVHVLDALRIVRPHIVLATKAARTHGINNIPVQTLQGQIHLLK